MTKINKIAELLPDGLTEDTVTKIAELVETTISEAVAAKFATLNNKVVSYIRTHMDTIKESALAELELESDVYRNAKMFESIRDFMAVELNETDEDSAITKLSVNQSQLEEENSVLVDELNKILAENTKLVSAVKILNDKYTLVESKAAELEGEVSRLEESGGKAFKSSEQAVIISENRKDPRENPDAIRATNEFITDDMLTFLE